MNHNDGEYLHEGLLYSIWKYTKGMTRKDYTGRAIDRFTFPSITGPGDQNYGAVYFIDFLKKLNIKEIPGLTFNLNGYRLLEKEGYRNSLQCHQDNREDEYPEYGSVGRILSNNFTLQDVENVCLFSKFKYSPYFYFDRKIPSYISDLLNQFLEDYLSKFLKNELISDSKNYYKFAICQNYVLQELMQYQEKFGNRFIYKYSPLSADNDITRNYLIVHTLIALEYLKYIIIEKFDTNYENKRDLNCRDKIQTYFITVRINKNLEKLMMSEKSNNTPPECREIDGIGYLIFNDLKKKIRIGGAGTRQFKLLQSLMEPKIGIKKTTQALFEAIRTKKDLSNPNSGLKILSSQEKIRIIDSTIKNLQKNSKLQRRLKVQKDTIQKLWWIDTL